VKRTLVTDARLALILLAACSSRPSAVEAAHTSLGGDTIARVGSVAIPASLVAEVAKSQQIPASKALGLVVDDALAAAGAEREGLDKTPEVRRAVEAALARTVVLEIRDAARDAGPPTDEEVTEVTQAHWTEVDLPESLRVIHAVVLKPEVAAKEAEAAALASAILAAEAKATSADDFEALANAVPHGDLKVKVERLPPFVADGRQTNGRGPFDSEFTRAASTLAVGATSGVVVTPYGWHVIRMVERYPEHRVPFEERRRIFTDEVDARRARQALDRLQEQLVAKHPVSIANGCEDLMTEGTMSFLGVERTADAPTP
jgi:parvulin-like peptidyl-prolyl isomerase